MNQFESQVYLKLIGESLFKKHACISSPAFFQDMLPCKVINYREVTCLEISMEIWASFGPVGNMYTN